MAFAMANSSNPSAMTCALATKSEGALDGAAVGLMTGVAVGLMTGAAVGSAHLMNDIAFLSQSKCHCINIGNELEELAHLCNVSHWHFEMGCEDS
jgi:hypothetical protein